MIADIHNKISSNGSNLSDRLEDQLTGDFFGTLRYIPFHAGLQKILAGSIYPKELSSHFDDLNFDIDSYIFWDNFIRFWPPDENGEIDVLIDMPTMTIGIEVKYLSGLSSDDDIFNESYEEAEFVKSQNQLARESRIVEKYGKHKRKMLLFLAQEEDAFSTYNRIVDRRIIKNGVVFGVISWQDALQELHKIQIADPYQQLMLNDLSCYLAKKRFEKFRSFYADDLLCIEPDNGFLFEASVFDFHSIMNMCVSRGEYYEFR